MYKNKVDKIDRMITIVGYTSILYVAIGSLWMWLEKFIYGCVQPRMVDNLISIPIIISLYFNAKHYVDKN